MRQDIKERIEQIQNGIVPEGYKKTKVGIIPKSWGVKELENIYEIFGGESIPRSNLGEVGHPYLHYGDIHKMNQTSINIPDEINSFSKLNRNVKDIKDGALLTHGDIVFADASEDYKGIGKHVVIINKNNIPFISGLHTIIAKPKPLFREVETKFQKYVFINNNVKKQFMFFATGISVLGITLENIKRVKIPIPSRNEQQRIASTLETWDRVIELKEKLIQEKQTQKKGLMEKLITHFPRNLNIYYMKEIFEERKETGFDNYELLAVTTKDGVIKRSELDRKDTSSSDKRKYKLVCPGDIAYNTMRMWQGVSGLSNYKGIVSPAYTVLIPNKTMVDPLYSSYLFKTPFAINIFKRFSQGLVKDTLSLKYANFKSIRLRFPNLNEQQHIAKILSTADREIELLNEEVELLKQQKKGLMQLLLTGIIRVKGDDDGSNDIR